MRSRARTPSCRGPQAASSAWAQRRAAGRLRSRHRLRHGGHVDRRLAFRRRVRARVRDPGCRRADAGTDDEHPHRGRRWRLDAAVRRRAPARRTGLGGRQSRTGLLPPRRAVDGHRCQPDAGPDPARSSSRVFGPDGDQPLDAEVVRERFAALAAEVERGDRPRCSARVAGRGLHRHRRGQHGQCDQADLGAARLRRHALRARDASAAPAASTPAWSPMRSG